MTTTSGPEGTGPLNGVVVTVLVVTIGIGVPVPDGNVSHCVKRPPALVPAVQPESATSTSIGFRLQVIVSPGVPARARYTGAGVIGHRRRDRVVACDRGVERRVAWTAPGCSRPRLAEGGHVLQVISGPLPTCVTSVQLAVGTKSVTSDHEQVVVTWLPSVLGPTVHGASWSPACCSGRAGSSTSS